MLILFLVILWRGVIIAKNAPTTLTQFLAIGLTINIVLYGFFNAAVTSMILPTTGMPMPFISYGGSSLLSAGISVGLLINIARNNKRASFNGNLEQIRTGRRELNSTFIMSD